MSIAQKQAVHHYRQRLVQQGLKRFEVIGRDGDQTLIRLLARKLAEDGPESHQIRHIIKQNLGQPPSTKGNILAALRASPMVGAELDLDRPIVEARKVEL
ncbi:MAG: hypothetical protein Q4D91_12465 [Lautropia sp.]|nr:hypothetical protein [Lautropia sp.]